MKAATGGRGADVIYDGIGRAAMEENVAALALCGHWVSYGQASGPLPPIAPEALADKSVTLSRPVLFHYTAGREALNEIAQQTFEALRGGVIRVDGRHRYPWPPRPRRTATWRGAAPPARSCCCPRPRSRRRKRELVAIARHGRRAGAREGSRP